MATKYCNSKMATFAATSQTELGENKVCTFHMWLEKKFGALKSYCIGILNTWHIECFDILNV